MARFELVAMTLCPMDSNRKLRLDACNDRSILFVGCCCRRMADRYADSLRCAGIFVFHAGKADAIAFDLQKPLQLDLEIFGRQSTLGEIDIEMLPLAARLIERHLFDNKMFVGCAQPSADAGQMGCEIG